MNAVTLPAHFDGQQIVLDEPYPLEAQIKRSQAILRELMEETERLGLYR